MWRIIATWPFGLHGVEAGARVLLGGATAMDAVETAVREVESGDYVDTVGLGGRPNRDGEVELDAAIMDGSTLRLGAVAAVRKFRNPVSIARRVMEASSHCLLVGAGAERFALEQGFHPAEQCDGPAHPVDGATSCDPRGHDTICVIALDKNGNIAVATSTSGLAGKLPGRVGDSPLVGSGFYADSLMGAAAGTGVGECIMRGCLSIRATHLMQQGRGPAEACAEAIRELTQRCRQATGERLGAMSLIAMSRDGSLGASTNLPQFTYAVASETLEPCLRQCNGIGDS